MEKNARKKSNISQSNQRISVLVDAVKHNDTSSFVELLGIFSTTISNLAYSFSLPDSEHEDLCQEARMALYRAAMSYNPRTAKFSTYALTCMTNAMISFARKYLGENGSSSSRTSIDDIETLGSDVDVPQELVTAKELEEMLSKTGFAGLSDYERQVLGLKLSGLRVSQIAKNLAKPSKSIENTLFRARRKLKQHIDGR